MAEKTHGFSAFSDFACACPFMYHFCETYCIWYVAAPFAGPGEKQCFRSGDDVPSGNQ